MDRLKIMPTPETQSNEPIPEVSPRRPPGVLALFLLAIAGFVLVYGYLDITISPDTGQTASVAAVDSFAGIPLEAKSAIVVDLVTGKTLYALNADAQLPLASLTKVPLALVVSEVLRQDTIITIPYDTAPKGALMRLGQGEKWKIGDVVNFTLVASSNQGADILAIVSDESVRARYPQAPQGSATLWRMNDLARQLGLAHSYFLNDNGLDISLTQAGAYGSARDVATIFAYAASTSPEWFTGTTRDGLLLTGEEGHTTSALNTNEALGAIPGLIMGKTGFTDLAGGNLAIVFDVGLARPVVAVVLGSSREGRFADMKLLVTAARAAIAQQ